MKAIREYTAYLKHVRNLSPATVEAYIRDLQLFAGYISSAGISAIEYGKGDVRGFLSFLTDRKLSSASINRIISAVRGYFGYLVRYENLVNNPFSSIKSLKRKKRFPDFFFESEVDEFLALPEREENSFLSVRDKMILELLYSTGCRVSEITGINVKDINFSDNSIIVKGKGNKERFVFIGRKAVSALRQYLFYRKNFLKDRLEEALIINRSGKRITTRGIFYIVDKYITKMAIEKKLSPHSLRHTFATHILDRGGDIRVVQELLGHSSLSSTQIYTHMGQGRLKKIYNNTHPHAKRSGVNI